MICLLLNELEYFLRVCSLVHKKYLKLVQNYIEIILKSDRKSSPIIAEQLYTIELTIHEIRAAGFRATSYVQLYKMSTKGKIFVL